MVKEMREDAPFDEFLTSPHLLEQSRIPNDPGCVFDFPARLVQSSHHPHYGAFHDICQIGDAVERHATGPLVHHFDHAKSGLANKVVGVVGRQNDLVQCLDLVHFFRDLDNLSDTAFQAGGQSGCDIRLLLKDKCGEECHDLFRFVGCEHIFEHQLGQDELVSGMDLVCAVST